MRLEGIERFSARLRAELELPGANVADDPIRVPVAGVVAALGTPNAVLELLVVGAPLRRRQSLAIAPIRLALSERAGESFAGCYAIWHLAVTSGTVQSAPDKIERRGLPGTGRSNTLRAGSGFDAADSSGTCG